MNPPKQHYKNRILAAMRESLNQTPGTSNDPNSYHHNCTDRVGYCEGPRFASGGEGPGGQHAGSRASALLRHYRELDPRFMNLMVLDGNGVPVAATDKPAHYAPVDEVFWQGVAVQGKGAIYVTAVLYDGLLRVGWIFQ